METDDGHLNVIIFTAPEPAESLAEEAEDLIGTCNPERGTRDTMISLVGLQETISSTIREYEAAGVSPNLEKLGAYEGESYTLWIS